MIVHRRLRIALVATTLVLPMLVGCDFDSHPTATGRQVQAPETKGTQDPGEVTAGGPGAPGQSPK